MSASIHTTDGETITEGLQGSRVCDAAIQAARRIAASRGAAVVLDDDDGSWLVAPSGRARAWKWPSSEEG